MEDMVLYLEDIVTPTIKDFEANPTSVRHAFLACVATFRAIDYLAYPDKSANVRQRAREASPAFATVDLVAHAFKHVASGNPNKKRLKAGEVVVRRPAEFDTAEWDMLRWDDGAGGVTIDTDREVDVLAAVKEAVHFLRTKGRGRGLLT